MLLLVTYLQLAASTLDSLKQLAHEKGLPAGEQIDRLAALGFQYWYASADSALYYGRQVVELAESIDDDKGRMEGHNIMGIAYWSQGNFPEAIITYRKGLEIATSDTGFQYAIPSFLTNIGICYKAIGAYDKALDAYLQALSLVQDNQATYASTLNNIGLLYQELDERDKAMDQYQQALAIAEELKAYPQLKTSIQNNIGNLFFTQENWRAADAMYTAVLEQARINGSREAEADALNNLSVLEQKRGNFSEARKLAVESLRIAEDMGKQVDVGESLLRLAKLERAEHKLWNARYFADSALAIGVRHDKIDLQRNANKTLADIYESLNFGSKALFYYKNFVVLQDSLESERKTRQIMEVEAKYELRAMEAQNQQLTEIAQLRAQQYEDSRAWNVRLVLGIILLFALSITTIGLLLAVRRSRNRQRTQKEELEELNAIKDQMFSIVSHDFKSPLNSLRSILNLVEEGELTDDDLKRVIPALQKELGYTSQLLENLLYWAKSQMKGIKVHPKEIDLRPLIRFDEDLLLPMAEKKQIELKVDLPQSLPAYADEDMIQLVIRNIMSNALKFTPQGGMVKVNAFTEEEHWCIQVKDTGVGIPPEKKARLFEMNNSYKTRGTDNEKGSGLGLKLCKEFVEKNRGWIWVSSEEGEGTTFSFTVPKRPPLT